MHSTKATDTLYWEECVLSSRPVQLDRDAEQVCVEVGDRKAVITGLYWSAKNIEGELRYDTRERSVKFEQRIQYRGKRPLIGRHS